MVKRHWAGILAWHQSHLSTGLLEGTNSLIQAAKARARGYRNKKYMITIIYLIAAKLPRPSLWVTHTHLAGNLLVPLHHPGHARPRHPHHHRRARTRRPTRRATKPDCLDSQRNPPPRGPDIGRVPARAPRAPEADGDFGRRARAGRSAGARLPRVDHPTAQNSVGSGRCDGADLAGAENLRVDMWSSMPHLDD